METSDCFGYRQNSIVLLIFISFIPVSLFSNNIQMTVTGDLLTETSYQELLFSDQFLADQVIESNFTEFDPIVLEEFVDNLFTEQFLSDYQAPGVVISFVHNGTVILSKGYGWSNLSSASRVDPNNTVFRAGSVSKSFVATAVMQLYEQNLLNLSADINDYLFLFQINNTYPTRPITMSHLLTHTAGLDEVWNVTTVGDSEIPNLGNFLASNIPLRIFPPGEVICYSNYGYALAGYIVEVITGVPFSTYVKNNILNPLGMNSSGFEQPMSPLSLSNAAQGYYVSEEEEFVPVDQYYFNPYPAGSFFTTGADISKFMLVHLNGGVYNNQSILNESTVQYMHERQFSHHPALEGFCYGFYEYLEYDKRAIHHAGDLYGFASELMLFPDMEFGYFISQDGVGNGLREVFTAVFMNEFFSGTYPTPQPTIDFKDRMYLYKGTFWHTRYPHEDYEVYKEILPLSRIVLSVNEQLNLLITNITEADISVLVEWIEIEPFLFQLDQTDIKLALHPVDDQIEYIFLGISSYERQEDTVSNTSSISTTSLSSETSRLASGTNIELELFSLLFGLVILIYYRRKHTPIFRE